VIRRTEPLRHDALAAEFAGVREHDVAVALVMLIEDDARTRTANEQRQFLLAVFDRRVDPRKIFIASIVFNLRWPGGVEISDHGWAVASFGVFRGPARWREIDNDSRPSKKARNAEFGPAQTKSRGGIMNDQHDGSIDFKGIAAAALANAKSLLAEWLPVGRFGAP
jgi:hypothetical protein